MYKKVDTSLNFLEREKEVIDFWKANKVFEKSAEKNKGGETFSFYDGPPTANGKPHIGHILTRVIKDIIPRYQSMKGKYVLRKAGWDTHGLPVELEVEKSLGLDGKQDIEKYGIEPFIKKCKESVWKYKGEWERMSERVGYWVDMDEPYITYEDNYIESVWWAIKEIANKGLLYKGHKIVPYCPRCGTALSSHEVAQGYKDVKDATIFVKFKLQDFENKYFLAWTTTPWTLPSNVSLCVNPKENYAEIQVGGEIYIMAESLIGSLFEEYEILSVKKGKEYEFTKYQPLFDFAKGSFKEDAYYVTCGSFVTLKDGTGIVHIAPAFGEDDANIGRTYNLPFVQLVDDRGKFVELAKPYYNIFVKDADRQIIDDLKAENLIVKEMPYEHSYPFCWRCDTPLLYYARSSWFIKVTAVKEQLIKANNSVNWIPPSIGSGRMGNFLENVIDWGLSRERYWGTPLPVWTCGECDKIHVIGSKAELKEMAGLDGDIELHRPYIDAPVIKCECGGDMKRTPEVIDCWFDSGSMPFAQFHYPFENKKLFEENFPAHFISEAVDQTRGWFYTLLAISTLLFDKSSFKNCIVLGHVNDKNGVKMSKHKGNVVDPWEVLDKQGADAVRWYFYTASSPWLPSRFYEDAVSEAQRKYMGTIWNTYAFFVLYADIDKYNPSNYKLEDCKLNLMDKWILSKLNSLVASVDKQLENYNITDSARSLSDFADILSNWYVRRGRERYWASDMNDDKIAAFTTLYTVLVTFTKLTAPYTPFIAETMYQNLVPSFYQDLPKSVLCDFPKSDKSYIDKDLERGMDKVLDIVVLGRAARNSSNIKNRQPLAKMFVSSGEKLNLSEQLKAVALDELNIKEFEEVGDANKFVSFKLKPQLKTLGPKYGAKLGTIRTFLETCNAEDVVKSVKSGGVCTVPDEDIQLSLEDLLISTESAVGFISASDNGITVALDTNITESLLKEGLEREIVSKLQNMRKDAGFEVTDRIVISYCAEGHCKSIFSDRADSIKADVLADTITEEIFDGYSKDWEIGGDTVTITIVKTSDKV